MKRHFFQLRFTAFQKVLLSLCAFLIISSVFVTAWVMTSHPERIGAGLRKIDPKPVKVEKKAGTKNTVYKDIGKLRAITADVPPVSLVVTPFFTFPTTDDAFFEELVQKKRKLRSVFLDYFALHSKDELLKMGDAKVKQELIEKLNAELMLGKIDVLYFEDYIFLN
ncbi:MAG: hypothetical protein PUF61_09830 [Spirochaetales bacterium]|nr:hypothetical protein [Spirochaetales bacterium]